MLLLAFIAITTPKQSKLSRSTQLFYDITNFLTQSLIQIGAIGWHRGKTRQLHIVPAWEHSQILLR